MPLPDLSGIDQETATRAVIALAATGAVATTAGYLGAKFVDGVWIYVQEKVERSKQTKPSEQPSSQKIQVVMRRIAAGILVAAGAASFIIPVEQADAMSYTALADYAYLTCGKIVSERDSIPHHSSFVSAAVKFKSGSID